MRTRILAAFVVGGLLVGAGFLTSVISAPTTAQAQEETEGNEDDGPIPRIIGFLGEVLDELVGEGTISEEQADAVVDAVENKASEAIQEHQELRELLTGLFDDDVLTAEEAEQLPGDHPLLSEQYDEAWEDGELTMDELIRRPHRFFGPGHRFGLGPFSDIDPESLPELRRFTPGWLPDLGLGDIFDEGGLDQEEYDSFDDDHPLREIDVTEYLEDGLVTPDELRQIFRDLWNRDSDQNA